MPRRRVIVLSSLIVLFAVWAPAQVISLAGTWGFRLDPDKLGHQRRWQESKLDSDTMFLPGSTDQAGYGQKTSGPEKGWLSRPYTYEGPAWYQKETVIPETWRGKRITLFLERPHWQTEVWVDGRALGSQNSLATPHIYDLSEALAPGSHRITICVDNSYLIDVGRNAHSVTEHTQTNWNGIVGRIELRASAPVWIDSVRLYPEWKTRAVRVEATIRNRMGRPFAGELEAAVRNTAAGARVPARIDGAESKVTLALTLGEQARAWDEWEPALYEMELTLIAGPESQVPSPRSYSSRLGTWDLEPATWDRVRSTFGLRDIGTRGTQFLLNGRPIFLRGTLECNIFPLTGYPPMRVEGWERLFRIARSYGLNHFRFHSWCPPEAAFTAADRAGFLLHVELPVWSNRVGADPQLNEFMRAEGHRTLAAYGNHPSFTMLCLGNELTGDYKFMDDLVAELKASDPRRLYTFTADYRRRNPGPVSDYYVTHNTEKGPVRIHGARFGKTDSGTDWDHSTHARLFQVPLVAHELGQWVTYPDYSEIAGYTGVLKPRNLEAFRDRLAARGMLDQAAAFQQASGHFAWQFYKEDIETAFRTPNFGGFQLLQLEDFPGQGEALVGLLDSFWNSKGILTPEEFRRFCGQTVALLRFAKHTWTSDETFTARAEVAHYGKRAIAGAVGTWVAQDESGRKIASGELPATAIPVGSVTPLGEIRLPLGRVERATRLRLSLAIKGTEAANDWDIWVYPKRLPAPPVGNVLVTGAFDAAAREKLEQGGRVLFIRSAGEPNENLLPIHFLPVFWSLSWFPKQPGTMGVLCDPRHPALADFPTGRGSDWQWWEVTESASAFILNDTPVGFRPIVQEIDDYHRNHKLGVVFEARVGKGRLLACSLALRTDLDRQPVARQLLYSLTRYAAGDRFQPQDELPLELLERLLR